jgi:hypothetical protein
MHSGPRISLIAGQLGTCVVWEKGGERKEGGEGDWKKGVKGRRVLTSQLLHACLCSSSSNCSAAMRWRSAAARMSDQQPRPSTNRTIARHSPYIRITVSPQTINQKYVNKPVNKSIDQSDRCVSVGVWSHILSHFTGATDHRSCLLA